MLSEPELPRSAEPVALATSMTQPVFPAVEPASGVYPHLVALRAVIADDPALRAPGEVRAELLPRRLPTGEVVTRRFYWSARRTDPTLPLGFTARTLHTDAKQSGHRIHDFPDEPVMRWLVDPDGPLLSHGPRARVEVLRYIPLRRLTFRLHDGAGLRSPVIAKTKRASSLIRAARVMVATQRSVDRATDLGFVVPQPVGLDIGRRLLYLEELPGRALSDVWEQLDEISAMRRLGHVQRELHELQVSGTATRTVADWLSAARVAADQVALLAPSTAEQLADLVAELGAGRPRDGETAFCQGDFVPSQILCGSSRWAVLDLDDGHYADPQAEVTALYAALPRELSVPEGRRAESLRDAYLEGYLRRAGIDVDPARWRWFLTVATLRYLARRLVKGRAQPGEVAQVLAGIAETAEPF